MFNWGVSRPTHPTCAPIFKTTCGKISNNQWAGFKKGRLDAEPFDVLSSISTIENGST